MKADMSKENNSYLGKLELNWADEADFTFFDVFSEEEKEDLVSALKELGDEEITISFGTNESSEYSGNDILEALEFEKIPDAATAKFIEEHVCSYSNSIMNKIDSIYDMIDDEIDDEAEDDEETEEDF